MAMSVGEISDEAPMSEINVIPLVDIMLVLLIIFLITVPVVLETVNLKLPDVPFRPDDQARERQYLGPLGGHRRRWPAQRRQRVVRSLLGPDPGRSAAAARTRAEEARGSDREDRRRAEHYRREFPEVHIRGDVNTPYQCIGGVIYTMQYAGFQKIGFISEPAPGSATLGRL